MARRSEHSLAQIREMILQAAEDIVDEQGLDGLTVRKIALEIGYTVGSIYMAFASMNDLIMQLKARQLERLVDQLDEYSDEDAESWLKLMAKAYYEFARSRYPQWQHLFVAVDRQPLPNWYVEKISQMLQPWELAVSRLFPALERQQWIVLSNTLWASVHGLCLLSLNGGLGAANDTAPANIELLVDSFIRGCREQQFPVNATPPETSPA